ncbi:VOC family protein [Leucobacter sp. CSA2]|uniref:VOC family protein n=1 Tax=Leucobacter edaphi TaxID=2796472 RepID=A0A934QCN7_9MICO|nr:VOC family protein [Leucobacter edaphi]MBK0422216.1 VOC family protein [Leucobacter edaphi]
MSDITPTPGRPVHFEIHAAEPKRAVAFYSGVFGWTVEDWSEFAGMPYFGVRTGEGAGPGIDGAIMQRHGANPEPGAAVAGAVLTMGVESFDRTAEAILAAGGTVALPKAALPGMAWQGYFLDLDGNVFGIHEPDPEAK